MILIFVIAAVLGVGGAYAYSRITDMCNKEIEAAVSEAEGYVAEGDFYNAICTYDQSMKYDLHKTLANRRKETFKVFASQLMDSSYDLIRQGNYTEAVKTLGAAAVVDKGDYADFTSLYKTCDEFQNSSVYTGEITSITFRPAIAYPDKAFDGDDMQEFMTNAFVTAGEFEKTLKKFYENGYVLTDIHNIYGVDGNGAVYKKDLYVPNGKKPLILWIDDLNYYDFMRQNGMVTGMEVGGDGKTIVSYTDTSDGRVYSDNNDVVPIVDRMVKEHPDFSWGLAKGTVALTAYEGVLGFRTNEKDTPEYETNLTNARHLAEVMKAEGWSFACKGYGDINPAEMSAEDFYADLDAWIHEAGAVVGATDIYAYPAEAVPDENDEKVQYMMKQNFRLFCSLSDTAAFTVNPPSYAAVNRRLIDGSVLANNWLSDIADFSGAADETIRGTAEGKTE